MDNLTSNAFKFSYILFSIIGHGSDGTLFDDFKPLKVKNERIQESTFLNPKPLQSHSENTQEVSDYTMVFLAQYMVQEWQQMISYLLYPILTHVNIWMI